MTKTIITDKSERYILYPHDEDGDTNTLNTLLEEITNVLRNRSDGIRIVIHRSNEYPKEHGKKLITKVEIDTWDCSA